MINLCLFCTNRGDTLPNNSTNIRIIIVIVSLFEVFFQKGIKIVGSASVKTPT